MYKSAPFQVGISIPIPLVTRGHSLFALSSTRMTISQIALAPPGRVFMYTLCAYSSFATLIVSDIWSHSGLPSSELCTIYSILRFDLYPGGH